MSLDDGDNDGDGDGDGADEELIEFTCDDRKIRARKGQSVAAALWAHGDRVLSRSTKYHRPRGWACGTGDCANCTMRVDGIPNIRTCIEPAREGQRVEGQNAWPSVRHDLFSINDLVFRSGIDHHHGFVRPRVLYPLFGAVIRAFAGWGRISDRTGDAPRTEVRRVDVVVAGAGPAGLAAATAAAQAGAEVLLIDREGEPGGLLNYLSHALPDPDTDPPGSGKPVPALRLAARWRREAQDTGRVILQERSTLTGLYPDRIHMIRGPGTITLAKADATILATGGLPNEGSFEGNDRPGVMSATGCLALLNREGVRPGRRALVHGAGAHGLVCALELHKAGVDVVAITEAAKHAPGPRSLLQQAEHKGIPVWTGTDIARTHGHNHLHKITLRTPQGRRRIKADLLVVALGAKTLPFALQGLGARLKNDPARGGTVPVLDEHMMTTIDGLYAAGDAAGIAEIQTARTSGRLAGLAAAARLGFTPHAWDEQHTRLRHRLQESGIGAIPGDPRTDSDPGDPHTPTTTTTTRPEQEELLR